MLSKDGIKADKNISPLTLIIISKKLHSSKFKSLPQCMMQDASMILTLILINALELSPISSISSIKDSTLLKTKVLNFSSPSLNFYKVKMLP